MNALNPDDLLERMVSIAFAEDAPDGDLSTRYLLTDKDMAVAAITAKADGVISGLSVAEYILHRSDAGGVFTPHCADGDEVHKGDTVATITAPYASLLRAERVMLNYMQRMSGIATYTRRCVQRLSGTKTKILDTRKTLPGHRHTDKMAVRHGGGTNHRNSLSDMVMLKENHIKVAGGIAPAVAAIRPNLPISVLIEVETTTLDEVREAVEAGADVIMLDNMPIDMMAEAVSLIEGRAKIEASGNMTLERLPAVAAIGVDYISMGALTHSVTALDLSMIVTETYHRE